MSEADAAEAKRRAEWLHKHKAHKDWVILSVSEIAVIKDELLLLERELAEAREDAMRWEKLALREASKLGEIICGKVIEK